MFISPSAFFALVFSVSGCASAPLDSSESSNGRACAFERGIGDGRIGPIRSGSSLDEIRSSYSVAAAPLPYSDEMGFQISTCDQEAIVIVEIDEKGAVESMSTTSTSFQTDKGGKVGMSLNQLQGAHTEGIISTGVEEGGWIAFRLDDISGYFEFSLEGVEFSCLQDRRTCGPEFFEKQAIRYWAK